MRKCLLDTGIANDYVHRRGVVYAKAQARKAMGDRLGICTPVLGELWAGVELSATRNSNRTRLLRELPKCALWPFDKKAAQEFGRIHAELKRMGRPMQQIDIQIAAIALSMGNCTVVTKDSDFKAIPGLAVEDWSIP
jgi:tRNA(fMet)-specific endonuclease VapC